jgi:hypothetical protein
MAAGLGFKDFATGEVLTAADVDGYLMQGVWVFASATARDAAVTSPQEGNFAYLKDTNVTTYYTGSAWANLDTTGMTNPMTTTGDTIYSSSGSTPARLGIGTAGQVLTVNSGATAPEWATSAAGGMTLLNTGGTTLSSSSTTINLTVTGYKNLFVIIQAVNLSNNTTVRVYFNATQSIIDHVKFNGYGTSTDPFVEIDANYPLNFNSTIIKQGNTSNGFVMQVGHPDTSEFKPISGSGGFVMDDNRKCSNMGGGVLKLSSAITSITFAPAAGTFSGGTVFCYGVK